MRIPAAITRATIILLAGVATVGAQEVRPMTAVRISTDDGRSSLGRLMTLDTASIALETSRGDRVSIARRNVTLFERRGRYTARGAAILGVGGAVAGGLFAAALTSGFCASDDACSSEIPGAFLAGGFAGGSVGAVIGGALGSLVPRWTAIKDPRMPQQLALGTSVRNGPTSARARGCLSTPRVELQSGLRMGEGERLSVALECHSRFTGGIEAGMFDKDRAYTSQANVTPSGTAFTTTSETISSTRYQGAFMEVGIIRRVVDVRWVNSVYLSRVEESLAIHHRPQTLTTQANSEMPSGFQGDTRSKGVGAASGLRATLPLGPNFSIGAAARVHVLDGARRVDSGMTLAFRP